MESRVDCARDHCCSVDRCYCYHTFCNTHENKNKNNNNNSIYKWADLFIFSEAYWSFHWKAISTSTLNTTTQPSYPNGIYLLTPGNPLLNISNPSSSSPYYNVSWLYYAQAYNETLTFAIQNNPSYTQIDDVSVLYGTQQLLCNGDFEYGNMNCWQGANHLSTSNPHNGTYCYNDGVVGAPDYVWQTFNTTPGALLYISFWIAWGGSGGGVYTNVSIYPWPFCRIISMN